MILPESINLEQSDRYVLSIRITPNNLLYSITEPGNEKNYYLQETTFSENDNLLSNIQRIIFDFDFLTLEFKQTNVIFVSKDYDLIPASFFDRKKQKDLYNITHLTKADHVVSGLIEKQDVVTLFAIDKNIFDFLSRNLWNPQFFHHSNLMASMLEEKGKVTGISSKMYLNFHDSFLDVICFSGSKLVHCITYEKEAPANQLYYILKLWECCEFDQLADTIYIVGKPDEMIPARLQEYFKKIERINAPSEIFFWSEDAQKAPLDLISLAL
jgi:hypothetical protein